MRLLPKQEIQVKKAQEKRVEVDEGLKLARRVDNLREIVAQEEASLASFRSSTLKNIAAEVKKAEDERVSVVAEVEKLRSELEQGTKALDQRKIELDTYQESLEKLEITLTQRVSALKTLASKIKERSKETNEYHNRILYAHKVMQEMNKDVSAKHEEAHSTLEQVRSVYDRITALTVAVEMDLRTRDIEFASQERDLTIKTEDTARKQKQLEIREVQLLDREQTLEREFNRLKKKYG